MKRDLFEAGLNEAAAGQGCVHLVGRKGAAPRRIMAQLLRYGESNFWFVSSCNGLRAFAAVWPYSPGSQSRCRTVRFTVRFEFIRPGARLRHLIGQLKFTLSQARNRQTVTCAASLVLCVAHTLIGRTRCPWQACSGGPRSLSAGAVGFVQSAISELRSATWQRRVPK